MPDRGPIRARCLQWPALFLDHDLSVRAELTRTGPWEGAAGRPAGVPPGDTKGLGQALKGAVSPRSLSKRKPWTDLQ